MRPAVFRFQTADYARDQWGAEAVSADISQDQRTGSSYYLARITIPLEEVNKLGGPRLVPGMPVDAFIQTDARTVVSFLVKPLRDQTAKAFRER